MAAKRPLEATGPSSKPNSGDGMSISVLVDEIRAAAADKEKEINERADFIKSKLDGMTEEERLRFEFFMQSSLSRSFVKDTMARALKGKEKDALTDEVLISVAGLAKLFVGELVERSVDALEAEALVNTDVASPLKSGIQVSHIREAFRQMKKEKLVGYPNEGSYLFNSSEIVYDGQDDII